MKQKIKFDYFQKTLDTVDFLCYTYLAQRADVAESADATDLKSVGKKFPYRFKSGHRHHDSLKGILYRGVEQPGSSSGS